MLRTASSAHDQTARGFNRRVSSENRPFSNLSSVAGSVDSSLDATSQGSNHSINAQARKLRLRKSRFRGATVPARNLTPPSNTVDSGEFAYDADALEDVDSSPVEAREQSCRQDGDVLQEISNSSMRRKKKTGQQDRNSLPHQKQRDTIISTDTSTGIFQFADPNAHISSTRAAEACLDRGLNSRAETKAPRRPHRTKGKSVTSRHSVDNGESAQYVEHLESQLAAMETQLSSLGSPSSIAAQTTKLKDLNSEVKMLRQEVSDWEGKFRQRVQEQFEEHDIAARGLKAEVKTLQRSAEQADAKIKEAEAEVDAMRQQLESTNRLNQDLERRVEFMSELLATSPTKLSFDDPHWPEASRRSPPLKPTSRILPVSSAARFSICGTTPARSAKPQSRSPSPTSAHQRAQEEQNPFDCLVQPTTGRVQSADFDSEASEQTLINDGSTSPVSRRWTAQYFQSDGESRARPARRMRRFYTGSTGPRALILPAATHSGAVAAASAPVTAAPTPTLPVRPLEESPLPNAKHGNNRTPSRPQTLPGDFMAKDPAVKALFMENVATTTTIPSRISNTPRTTTPTEHRDGEEPITNDSARSSASRASTASIKGDNLFQELIRVAPDNDDRVDTSDAKSPTPSGYHSASKLSPNPSESIDEGSPPLEAHMQPYDPGGTRHEPQSGQSVVSGLPFPFTVLGRVAAAASKSMDQQTPRIKCLMRNMWSMLALSRPVLEFRWWLVRLLLGGLRKRKRQPPPPLLLQPSREDPCRPTRVRGIGTSGRDPQARTGFRRRSARARHDDDSGNAVWDIFETREQYKHATPPPVSWLKFSITLVFAVGIAIKDGPASLFGSRAHEPRGFEMERVSDGGGLDTDDED